jgi:ABC-type uncharacterized transport system substrate-binding protein
MSPPEDATMKHRALGLLLRTSLIIVLLVAPLAAGAQPAVKVYRIAHLSLGSPTVARHLRVAWIQALRDLQWVEGQNLVIDFRYAEGRVDLLPALAADLVRTKPDVIFVTGDQAIKAAKSATSTVALVMIACDAVAAGLITSLARPGGNLTGITCVSREIAGKRIELLREHLPRIARPAVLYNPDDPGKAVEWQETEGSGRALGLKMRAVPVRDPKEFEGAFATMTREGVDALVVLGDTLTIVHHQQLVSLAAKYRMPTVYAYREFVTSGGLMSYGPDLTEMFRAAAVYIDKILRGAKPADLPVEQPTKFELIINLKTARALGLTTPPSVLARADEVIQ